MTANLGPANRFYFDPGLAYERRVMMALTKKDLEEVFTYHTPDADQIPRYNRIREKAHDLALEILKWTPACADQSAAIRLVREAMMTANAAIALKGRV